MLDDLINGFVGYLSKGNMIDMQEEYLKKQFEMQQSYYKAQKQRSDSLFNRNYYRGYLELPGARNLMKQVREQLEEQTRALRSSAASTGATPQAIVAAQKNNNRILNSAVGTLAEQGERNREQAYMAYQTRSNQLDDYMHKAEMDNFMKKTSLELQSKQNLYSFLQPTVNQFVQGMTPAVDILKSYIGDSISQSRGNRE